MNKVGYASGICGNCHKEISRPRPAQYAICDCYEYCPTDHGRGPYGTKMEPYNPDLTPNTYGPIVSNGRSWGDLSEPMHILHVCPVCGYHSSLKPVEVQLG